MISEEARELLEDAELLAEALEAKTQTELANELGVGVDTVRKARRLHGIHSRGAKPSTQRPPGLGTVSELDLELALKRREREILQERVIEPYG